MSWLACTCLPASASWWPATPSLTRTGASACWRGWQGGRSYHHRPTLRQHARLPMSATLCSASACMMTKWSCRATTGRRSSATQEAYIRFVCRSTTFPYLPRLLVLWRWGSSRAVLQRGSPLARVGARLANHLSYLPRDCQWNDKEIREFCREGTEDEVLCPQPAQMPAPSTEPTAPGRCSMIVSMHASKNWWQSCWRDVDQARCHLRQTYGHSWGFLSRTNWTDGKLCVSLHGQRHNWEVEATSFLVGRWKV